MEWSDASVSRHMVWRPGAYLSVGRSQALRQPAQRRYRPGAGQTALRPALPGRPHRAGGEVSDLKPWHDTVACPRCKVRVVVPMHDPVDLDMRKGRTASDLRCAACGYEYVALDITEVARVWWSAGAQAGREEAERERGARP